MKFRRLFLPIVVFLASFALASGAMASHHHHRVHPKTHRVETPFALSSPSTLPLKWRNEMKRIKLPPSAISVVVRDADSGKTLLAWNANKPRNPASTMKVLTTTSAFDTLGVGYRWKTEAFLDGKLDPDGTLHGNLILKGGADPKITVERWEAFMTALVESGVRRVTGDLLLDRSLFDVEHNAAAFDGEPLKPYNVGPDPLLVSFKSVKISLMPPDDRYASRASAQIVPPLESVVVTQLPRNALRHCGDWWQSARPRIKNEGDRAFVRFDGRYAGTCGVQEKYAAVLDVPTYVHDMFSFYFQQAGGEFHGGVRETTVPEGLKPFATLYSLSLPELIHDINKHSNNVMAQQVFLTLSRNVTKPPYSQAASRRAIANWLAERGIKLTNYYIDNGCGLSRHGRITANDLATLLAYAKTRSWYEDFRNSLPIAGVDGTLKKRFLGKVAEGHAQMKSGYLDSARALAGYVDSRSGKHFIAVIIVNGRKAQPSGGLLVGMVDDLVRL